MEEAQLIEELKSGSEKAFEALFKKYYPILTVFAKKYVFDPEIGKEIVQDLFVTLYEKRGNLQINASVKSYLFQSVKNRCLTYLSQQQLHTKHITQVGILQRGNDILETDYIEQAELEEKIFHSISNLPTQCQKIFRMNRLEGKKNKEIAEELDISIRTVETQISKALKILRGNLENYLNAIIVINALIQNL